MWAVLFLGSSLYVNVLSQLINARDANDDGDDDDAEWWMVDRMTKCPRSLVPKKANHVRARKKNPTTKSNSDLPLPSQDKKKRKKNSRPFSFF